MCGKRGAELRTLVSYATGRWVSFRCEIECAVVERKNGLWGLDCLNQIAGWCKSVDICAVFVAHPESDEWSTSNRTRVCAKTHVPSAFRTRPSQSTVKWLKFFAGIGSWGFETAMEGKPGSVGRTASASRPLVLTCQRSQYSNVFLYSTWSVFWASAKLRFAVP